MDYSNSVLFHASALFSPKLCNSIQPKLDQTGPAQCLLFGLKFSFTAHKAVMLVFSGNRDKAYVHHLLTDEK